MPAMPDLTAYRAWLQNRERSPGTIAKYLRDTARFFAESGAPQPPPKAAVAAWRDALAARGYAPASVNAMLAAVNAYQDFCGNPAGKAKPLKCQRRIFCEARRELSRAEYFRLLNAARAAGGRVGAVGTTSVRTLESAAGADGRVRPWAGDTRLFIRPGYAFRAVDCLVTNFHLPRSTLFMLVSAFSGLETMRAAYAHAIGAGYRFYSSGDASLLFPGPRADTP